MVTHTPDEARSRAPRGRIAVGAVALPLALVGAAAPLVHACHAPASDVERARPAPAGGEATGPNAPRAADDARYLRVLARVTEEARALAARAAEPADPTLPPWLRGLDYDASRAIRFLPDRARWRGEDRRFELQFFHRTPFSRDPVEVVEVGEDGGETPVVFDPDAFDYPDAVGAARDATLGFAGFRVHGPMHGTDYLDEVLVFLGASYFRSLGPRQPYGTSVRGLALDTGLPSGEEFPRFTRFWVLRPPEGDAEAPFQAVALLESARATGAFGFTLALEPDATRVDVDARVFLRAPVEGLLLAPMSSMFLFGEASPARFGDFRPEVHDADGLAVAATSGERVWRPLTNPPVTRVSDLAFEGVTGFGLLQRDRDFDHYQDLEARYHARPSVWVEPRRPWGPGVVRLLEIATELETDDNVAVGFVPAEVPRAPDDPLEAAYTVRFGATPAPEPPWRFVATRVATPRALEGARFFVELEGEGLGSAPLDALELVVDAAPRAVRVGPTRVERLPAAPGAGRVRGVFDVRAPAGTAVELRAFLRGPDRASETWTYAYRMP